MRKALILFLGAGLWGVFVWAFDHFVWDWLTHTLESELGVHWADIVANASSVLIPLLIAIVIIAVIFRIAKEVPAPIPQPNMKVSEAIDYIVNDSTAVLADPKKLPPPQWPSSLPPPAPGARITYSGVEHADARKQLNAKLISGDLQSWGLRQISTHIPNQFEHSIREIPKDCWDDMQLDFQSCLYYRGPYSQTMKIPGRTERDHWADIQLSRERVEHLWPRKSAVARLWSAIRRRPRISHARTLVEPGTPHVPTTSVEIGHSFQILSGTGRPFEEVAVNEHGVHRTISLGIKNIGARKISNCKFYRTYVSSLNDKEKVFLDGPFSLDPNEVRYVSVAMFNETKDLPGSNHLIGLSMPPGAFGAGVMLPRLSPDRRHIVSFVAESPNSLDEELHCELSVDEHGKLRSENV
jgi:hypothetical protein